MKIVDVIVVPENITGEIETYKGSICGRWIYTVHITKDGQRIGSAISLPGHKLRIIPKSKPSTNLALMIDDNPGFVSSTVQNLQQRSRDIELLEAYSLWLEKNGYMDVDWRAEESFAIDEFLKQTKQYKMAERKTIAIISVITDSETSYNNIGDVDGGFTGELKSHIEKYGHTGILEKLAIMQWHVWETVREINSDKDQQNPPANNQ